MAGILGGSSKPEVTIEVWIQRFLKLLLFGVDANLRENVIFLITASPRSDLVEGLKVWRTDWRGRATFSITSELSHFKVKSNSSSRVFRFARKPLPPVLHVRPSDYPYHLNHTKGVTSKITTKTSI